MSSGATDATLSSVAAALGALAEARPEPGDAAKVEENTMKDLFIEEQLSMLRLLDGVLEGVSLGCMAIIRFGFEISNSVSEADLVGDLLQGFGAKEELT